MAGPDSSHENVGSIAAGGRYVCTCISVCCQALSQVERNIIVWQARAAGRSRPLVNGCSIGMGIEAPSEVLCARAVLIQNGAAFGPAWAQ